MTISGSITFVRLLTSLVQMVERRFPKPNVEGSSPSRRVPYINKLCV